jgi:hypothetical protein
MARAVPTTRINSQAAMPTTATVIMELLNVGRRALSQPGIDWLSASECD